MTPLYPYEWLQLMALVNFLLDGSEHPIAYASRTLSVSEKNYSQIEKEALGLIFAVKKYHQYI